MCIRDSDGDVNFQGGNYNIARSRANSSIDFDDDAKARFGTGDDLNIYHSGDNSYIEQSGTGKLYIDGNSGGNTEIQLRANKSATSARFFSDHSVQLNYAGSKKFETSGVGVTVTGICEATSFAGDGSALSGVGGENDITSCLFI